MPIQMLHNPETGNGLLLQPPVGQTRFAWHCTVQYDQDLADHIAPIYREPDRLSLY